jgi:hypothetical protein
MSWLIPPWTRSHASQTYVSPFAERSTWNTLLERRAARALDFEPGTTNDAGTLGVRSQEIHLASRAAQVERRFAGQPASKNKVGEPGAKLDERSTWNILVLTCLAASGVLSQDSRCPYQNLNNNVPRGTL